MKGTWDYRLRRMMLPGLKRWILIIFLGIMIIVLGVFLLLGYHPLTVTGAFLREVLEHAADVLPHRISGILVITVGGLIVCLAVVRMTMFVLGAYLPNDREALPDVLYRRRLLDRGPRVAVIGGGTGLSTLLKGLKSYTNNITAIVTVGDDGGSSGRLRQEFGVLPPGDIRNCIVALADEEKLVTELFRYRFQSGHELEGHSFGNLFLAALCSMTNGDMLEAARVASRVLNSCGQVLPSTLASMVLVAEMEDGRIVKGESQIPNVHARIKRMRCEPSCPAATPEAVQALVDAELIILGPGSLYTSVISNLLVNGIADAVLRSPARKIYICNVMTQPGETDRYSVADHVEALMVHADLAPGSGHRLIDGVMINDEASPLREGVAAQSVRFDPERLRMLGVKPILRPLLSKENPLRHDPSRLAKAIMLWYFRQKRRKGSPKSTSTISRPQRIASL